VAIAGVYFIAVYGVRAFDSEITMKICKIALLLCVPLVHAEKPLWEAGFGLSALTLPAYKGSDEQTQLLLPTPFLVYRGEHLRIDRSAVRNVWAEGPRHELDLSLGAAPPVKSGEIQAREGMENLDPTFELGLSWKYYFVDANDQRLSWRLPIRHVVASNFQHAHSAGWVAAPVLAYEQGFTDEYSWRLSAQISAAWATSRHHRYFYDVEPEEARPDRPTYQAHGGYNGRYLLLGATRRFNQWWFGSFVRWDDLNDVAYADSPLVRQKQNVWIGISFSRIQWQSSEAARDGSQ
jgi:MipA family protein